jgi:hypothetical protein
MPLNEYQRQLVARIRSLPLTADPPGWKLLAPIAVGGLAALGFAEDCHGLLLVSSSGRGLIDYRTGERLARDYDSSMSWYQVPELTVEGIGPVAGRMISVAGIEGGGLNRLTSDGWYLEVVWPDWPDGDVILSKAPASLYQESRLGGCYKIARTEPAVACGFSRSGDVVVLAESHTVRIWNRVVSGA